MSFKLLNFEKKLMGKEKGKKLMEFLKKLIVDIYYHGRIYSVPLMKFYFIFNFYLLLIDGKRIYMYQ